MRKAENEIYDLQIEQQLKLEEGRNSERQRIAEDLHDGVISKIFGTRLSFGFLDLKGDTATLNLHQQLLSELQQIENEIRDISHNIKFENELQKFKYVLEDLLKKQSLIGGYNYSLEMDKTIYWNAIDNIIKINLYRIVQEALQNCTKYAIASLVLINFRKTKKSIILTIKDNGVGFDKKAKKHGIGIHNFRSRIQRLHGNFELNSIISKGTTLTFTIPINFKK